MAKVNMLILLVLAVFAVGCHPDPRTADVVMESPELTEPTQQAMSWWASTTHGDVKFRFASKCDSKDLDDERGTFCARINTMAPGYVAMDGTKNVDGDTYLFDDTANVVIRKVDDYDFQVRLIAHELGHVLGLKHVDGKTELMNPYGGTCFGPQTLGQYHDLYGVRGEENCQ